ncbi:hypothetical protein BTA51_13395 [Hahella sp. CCB-MM4]|uniref:DUF3103 domain-containing protein n=1 Tax=Hahella sp. (strain CCB-MM4) TaxID=1926491 RepID=UPI000B9B3B17|nr:DUF3103 domain-containing protein [Hahella sp. CCB-MM4]OZG72949.1 hypothetical protein BTA51_13395 [Hahella sp. CCB-MM4]
MRKYTALGMMALLLSGWMSHSNAADNSRLSINTAVNHTSYSSPGFVTLANEKRSVARSVAREISPAELTRQLQKHQGSVSVATLLQDVQSLSHSFVGQARRAEKSVLSKKGLANANDTLLELRIAAPSMMTQLQGGVEPLYAYEPDGDESTWQYIEAYDSRGGLHMLDVWNMPDRPVVVVDINAKKDLQLGLAQMQQVFAQTKVRSLQMNSLQMNEGLANESLMNESLMDTTQVTILDQIRLNDDEEPWISGKAEVYAIVSGVDPSRDEPALDIVDMPYLDYDGKTYYPNQVMVYWARYRWGAANIILMEHDDNTNYQQLAQKLLSAAAEILSALGQPEIGALVALGSGIVAAMPDHWFSNDDDYLDSFYTLEKSIQYTNRMGAAGNAMSTLRPYTLSDSQ